MKGIRNRAFAFLVTKIVKVPEGEYIPKWLWILRCIIFPLESYLLNNKYINYDPMRDIFTLYGHRYTGAYFRELATSDINQCFRIINRESGLIRVQHIKDCPIDCMTNDKEE